MHMYALIAAFHNNSFGEGESPDDDTCTRTQIQYTKHINIECPPNRFTKPGELLVFSVPGRERRGKLSEGEGREREKRHHAKRQSLSFSSLDNRAGRIAAGVEEEGETGVESKKEYEAEMKALKGTALQQER